VYINGVALRLYDNFDVNLDNNTVILKSGLIHQGDVIAVLSVPNQSPSSEFDIVGNVLTLRFPIFNSNLRVITFTNHDGMMLRSENFVGDLNRRYKITRPIVNENYIWVTVNGVTLRNKLDFTILDDGVTVQLGPNFVTTYADIVSIISVSSDNLAETVLGYRIFNDIFNRTHFKRLSKKNSTYLTQPLSFTDTEIYVDDSSVLSAPLISKKIPGVVTIDGERIEFFKVDGNVLKQLRRSTLGTSPSQFLQVGTKVIDQSPEQNIPFKENYYRQLIYTTATTNTYVISTMTTVVSNPIAGINTTTSDGIVFSDVAPAFAAIAMISSFDLYAPVTVSISL
jgi:hypothetical protein